MWHVESWEIESNVQQLREFDLQTSPVVRGVAEALGKPLTPMQPVRPFITLRLKDKAGTVRAYVMTYDDARRLGTELGAHSGDATIRDWIADENTARRIGAKLIATVDQEETRFS
jgi:hypothetical protein